MKVLFVSNPTDGQFNPLESIAHELLNRGVEVHICSAGRLAPRIEKLGLKSGASDRLTFHPLKDGLALEDFTPWGQSHPHEFHTQVRHSPGDLANTMNLITTIISPASDEYGEVVYRVRDVVLQVQPDMVVVDNFSPFAFDGVRLSKVPFITTSPSASSCVALNPSIFRYPLPLSGASGSPSSRSGLGMILNNIRFAAFFVLWHLRNPFPTARRAFRKDVLGLEPIDMASDSFMTAIPGMGGDKIKMVAALSFNVAGLDLYGPECFDKKVFFVGPCFPPSSDLNLEDEKDEIKDWLDEALSAGEEVIYWNMGSIFYYNAEDYETLVEALIALHSARPQTKVLFKVPKLSLEVQPIPPNSELPSFIRRETWIPSVENVLKHPSIKVVCHHGGGNSFNEAVSFGHPQLIISQWSETHDIAAYAFAHGIGLTVKSAPRFVKEEITESLETLLRSNSKFKPDCQRWKLKCQQAGGSRIAANIIMDYASQKNETEA